MRIVRIILIILFSTVAAGLDAEAGLYVNDSTRVNLLNHRAQSILTSDPGKAADLATEAKDLAEQLSYQNGLVESLRILGRSNTIQKDYLTALEHYLQASKALENQGNIESLAEIQMEIGLFFGEWGVHKKATEYFRRSYQTKEALGDTTGQIDLLKLLGDTYYQLNNEAEAKSYYQKLLILHKSREENEELLDVLLHYDINDLGCDRKYRFHYIDEWRRDLRR
jgi:tetratricopeptide (TPR) repeat protein